MSYLDPILMDFLTSDKKTGTYVPCSLSFDELFIKAVFHNNYDLVRFMVRYEQFNPAILEDCKLLNIPFPLYQVTMCYNVTMSGDFREEVMPFVQEQRENISKLLTLWKDEFDLDIETPIDFKKYEAEFYCLKDDEDFESVFLDPKEKFIETGCRKIDLELFEAVDKFQFARVEELLMNGADPNANLYSSDDVERRDPWNCFRRIGDECSYLCTCQIFSIIYHPHGNWYTNYALTDREIGDLIGWAAHEEMYNLLSKYAEEE